MSGGKDSKRMTSNPQTPPKVYFFGTCVIDHIYPRAGLAAIQLIEKYGIQVVYPQAQSCCGQPAFNSGYPQEARAVARHQIRTFHENYPIVVPSGSCAGMLKHHYPELFKDGPLLGEARRFAGRVVEFSAFLVHVLAVRLEDRGRPIKVAWHSSCHAMREMGVIEDSKSLIRQLRNVELFELENERECCGFGGTFAVKHPDISGAMAGDKIDDIRQTGSAVVLSGDCACLMHISGAARKRKIPLSAMHLAEFLWERING
jgi:L-lactate dehydrogenase complex protein LldE